jgi:hypothetical protein
MSYRELWWNDIDGKTKEIGEKNCPSATLSTTSHTLSGLGFCGERLVTNCLSHGLAILISIFAQPFLQNAQQCYPAHRDIYLHFKYVQVNSS